MIKVYIYSTICFIGLYIYNSLFDANLSVLAGEILSPLIISAILISIALIKPIRKNKLVLHFYAYVLFFAISIFSYFGLAGTITGSHATSTNPFIYGLSFYTAYLAFLIFRNNLSIKKLFVAANPIVLISGPMPVVFNILSSSL